MSLCSREGCKNERNLPDFGPPSRRTSLFRLLGNRLLTGVAIAVPLVVTYWVLAFAYRLVTGLGEPWLKAFGVDFPGLGFVITVLFFLALGFMAAHCLGRRLLERGEALVMRVPLAAPIYAGTKQVLRSLQGGGPSRKFQRVVVVDFLGQGSYVIGFATGHFTEAASERAMTTVFVPTAPNPTTGLLVAVPTDRVRDCDLSIEEASKMLFSGGLVVPPRPLHVAPSPDKTTV